MKKTIPAATNGGGEWDFFPKFPPIFCFFAAVEFYQALKSVHHMMVTHIPRCCTAMHHCPIIQFCIFCNNSILFCIETRLPPIVFEPSTIFACFAPYFYEHICYLIFA